MAAQAPGQRPRHGDSLAGLGAEAAGGVRPRRQDDRRDADRKRSARGDFEAVRSQLEGMHPQQVSGPSMVRDGSGDPNNSYRSTSLDYCSGVSTLGGLGILVAVVLRSRTLFLSIATLCVMFLGAPPKANAYTLLGIKWAGEPAPHVCCANFTYRQFAGHSNDYAGWVNGAAGWTNSIAYADWKSATVGEQADARDTDNGSVSWDGLSQWSYYTGSNGQRYFSAPVTVTLNYYYTKNYYVNKTTSVAEHELGHAMGLDHSSACVIMNPNTQSRYENCHVYQVQPDDAYGVNALY